jgi:hypothetical protein
MTVPLPSCTGNGEPESHDASNSWPFEKFTPT